MAGTPFEGLRVLLGSGHRMGQGWEVSRASSGKERIPVTKLDLKVGSACL